MGEGVSYQAQQQIKEFGRQQHHRAQCQAPVGCHPRRRIRYCLRLAPRRLRSHRLQCSHDAASRADARDQERGPLSRQSHRRARRRLHLQIHGDEQPAAFAGRFLSDKIGRKRKTSLSSAIERRRNCFRTRIQSASSSRSTTSFTSLSGKWSPRRPRAAPEAAWPRRTSISTSTIPLSTLRARIGDMVITSRAGSREGEQVELSQITVTVHDLSEVDETAESFASY